MNVKWDKKENELNFIPENDLDIWKLSRVFEKTEVGGLHTVNGEIKHLSLKPMNMFNAINRMIKSPENK